MTKKQLIIIHPHFTLKGGAGNFMLELSRLLTKDKVKVIIITQQVNQEYLDSYPFVTFESLYGPKTDSFFFWFLFPYWQIKTFLLIKKHLNTRYKTSILVNVFPSNWIVLPLKIFLRQIKIIWFCQEPSSFIHTLKWKQSIINPIKRFIAFSLSPFFVIIDKHITNFADEILVNSRFGDSQCYKVYHRHGHVIYPGVDIELFKPVPLNKKSNTILTVSRLTKFKNIDILINAFFLFSKIHTNYNLTIIGDGEEKQNLLNLVDRLKISDKVNILTGINDKSMASYYANAKVFVLCSKNEPFGMVAIEAMACGTPVIADNSGGPKEIILHDSTGILVDNLTPNRLSEILCQVLLNSEKLKKFSESSIERVKQNFLWKTSAKKLHKYL